MWWLVFDVNGERCVWLEDAPDMVQARFKATMAGSKGSFLEGHELDRKTAKKVPNDLVGRILRNPEAMRLLKKLG